MAKPIPGPDLGQWDYATYDAAQRRLYVTRTQGVTVLDLSTGVTTRLVDGEEGRATVLLPGGHEALSTFETGSLAVIFDTRTGASLAKIKVPPTPDAAVYDAGTRRVYVVSGEGDVSVIDPAKRKRVATIHAGGSLEYAAIDGRGQLFVNDGEATAIAVVDLARRKVSTRYALAGCEGPTGLTYVEAEELLVSVCDNGIAKAIDARTGRDLATLMVGPGPDAAIYDSKHAQVYVPSGDDGTLSVIQLHGRGQAPTVIDRLDTERHARTGALDPVTGTLYLPVAERLPEAPWEVPPVAGTYRVLVLERH